jgi:hypothetical protein
MAAVLGNSGNRGAFVTSFWYGGKRKGKRTGTGMLDILRPASPVPDWQSAGRCAAETSPLRRHSRRRDMPSRRTCAAATMTSPPAFRAPSGNASPSTTSHALFEPAKRRGLRRRLPAARRERPNATVPVEPLRWP